MEEKIRNWLAPKLEELELFFVDLSISNGSEIQLYVDGMTNITIAQCTTISRFLEQHLDLEPGLPENYKLEVSSPGMSRPLVVRQQYLKRVGKELDITLVSGEKQRYLLNEVGDTNITVSALIKSEKKLKKGQKRPAPTYEDPIELPFENIKTALIAFNF